MKCVTCHCEHIELKDVVEELHKDSDVVLVSVRVPVCRACGERYYDRRTMQFLREMEDKLDKGQVDLREVGRVLAL